MNKKLLMVALMSATMTLASCGGSNDTSSSGSNASVSESQSQATESGDTTSEEAVTSEEAITSQEHIHIWGAPTYEWNEDHRKCTAKRACIDDATHVEEETVDAESVTVDATEEEDGSITYTASFDNEAFEDQTDVEVIPSLPTLSKLVLTKVADPLSYDKMIYSVSALNKEITGRVKIPDYYQTDEDEEPLPVGDVGEEGFMECTGITYLYIPGAMTVVGSNDKAFRYCSGITTLIVSEGVELLGRRCFSDLDALVSVELPASLTWAGNQSFQGCDLLESVTFAEGSKLEKIDFNCFSSCPMLKEFVIPDGVYQIKGNAFRYDRGLTSVVIPASVTEIGTWAFLDCENLTSITFKGTMEQWENIAFDQEWNSNVPATAVHCSDGDVTL